MMIFNNSMNSDGTGSKRKALEMITNIFCKKPKENENLSINIEPNISTADNCSINNCCQQSLSVNEMDTLSGHSIVLPKSPISPRVKSIDRDMEALTLSRQDNPYIMQQLERLSVTNEMMSELNVSAHSSPARSLQRISISTNDQSITSDGNFIIDNEDSYYDNLHEKLIRSPPPNFPQNMSLFIFPESSNGSLQSYSMSKSGANTPSLTYMSPTFLLSNHNFRDQTLSANSKGHRISKDSILDDSKSNRYLSPDPNYTRYERRGSDSSIITKNWKTPFYNQSMAASSSSLLAFNPITAINQSNNVCNHTNDFNHCSKFNETDHSYKLDINSQQFMEMHCECYDNNDDNDDHAGFMSPSNSREALLKDASQAI